MQQEAAYYYLEAEYVATRLAAKECIWLRQLLGGVLHPQKAPTVLFCDNQGAIALTKNPRFHGRTKHIQVQFHFIREKVALKKVYCATGEMVADIFTKPLAPTILQRH